MRYFSELAYNGTNYNGWQKQPNAPSVQETIEDAFSTILSADIEVVGCGRTDTGVHASQYFMHFDFEGKFPKAFLNRVNKLLPADIAIRRIFEVKENTHARFDATLRSYEYRLVFEKNPFETHTAWHFPFGEKLDLKKMHEAARFLLDYEEFSPFCKTHTDVKTMRCRLTRSEWQLHNSEKRMIYHISSDRFLRGMVRLIVGMCLNVGLGKINLEDVRQAMDEQKPLKKSWSVPPHGLFLTEVKY
jgi:tRNA pseudouridine38-40 synthase